MSSDLATLSITEALTQLERKEISAFDLAQACKKHIDARNASLNAYLEVFADIEEQARAADLRRAQGEKTALLGIPLALKDNILLEGRNARNSTGFSAIAPHV
jgi:aspartyl-tRNA(Asn)/glutamyl-tRNA(Gln) amidotransferase subunit A